jgi:methionyl-tRNA synthetase
MRGREAIYLSGSDENQSYVVTKARQKGWTPRDTADRFADRVEAAFAALAIEPTVFARPASSRYHTRFCQEFFARLLANGKIERRTTPTLHCESCKRYLFEAHVSGTCPHCGHGSDGSACEDCARPNDCIDLLDPRCNQCGATPTVVETERFFFPLSRYEGLLRAYLSSVAMSPHMRALCETMLTDGLPDIAVSHLADWGIEVPVEGFSNQVIYVWFEMCPGYLAASQQAADRSDAFSSWEDIWKAPDTEIVQFFGFDNGYFHALLFPALLMAYDPQIRLPSVFVTNEFYLLDGQKFSSSREHAIWATDFAARQPADWVRFYLSLDRPECRRTNFTEVGYHSTISRELEGAWLPWLRGVGQRAIDEFDGLAPATATYTAAQKRFFGKLLGLIAAMEEALDLTSFSPPQSVGVLCDLVHTSAAFGATEAYLKGVDALRHERRTAVALELAAVRTLATLAAPVLPSLAGQLWQALGFLDDGPQRWATAPTFIPVGQDVSCLSCLSPW